jgi:hypothetical protein
MTVPALVIVALVILFLIVCISYVFYFKLKKSWYSNKGLTHLTGAQRKDILSLDLSGLPGLFSEIAWRDVMHPLYARKQTGSIVDAKATAKHFASSLDPRLLRKTTLVEAKYIFLIERRRPRDHLAEMGWLTALNFRRALLPVTIRSFRADPNSTQSWNRSDGVEDLSTLAAKYPNHRLILVTPGDGLVDPVYPIIKNLPDFIAWDEKFLMTPRSEDKFGRTEFAFSNAGFHVVSMGARGLREIAEIINNERALSSYYPLSTRITGDQWDERLVDPQGPSEPVVKELIEQLKNQLGSSAFMWICACSVYPILIPKLTEHLGTTLRGDDGFVVGSEDGFIQLCSLPWFREGVMPDWFRIALLRQLTADQLDKVRRVYMSAITLSTAVRDGGESPESVAIFADTRGDDLRSDP